ncbi:glycerol-3-phosphate dehydrogenase subunit GlpB [Deferribacterales bacterium RsTz2092]|nr:glycerol-3-phosphate dehydrogenase subunit B [Deferribacterales bacterium]
MTRKYDRVIVGGGLAGLMSALVAATEKKKVALLMKGVGSIAIASGAIDLYGKGVGKLDPFKTIKLLPKNHPYSIVGIENIINAIKYFEETTARYGYPYKSICGRNSFIPTPVGWLKPVHLIPSTMDATRLISETNIAIVGVEGLKDFSPTLIHSGMLKQMAYADKQFLTAMMPNPFNTGRDTTSLDLARYVDTIDGMQWLNKSLRAVISGYKVAIIPPILGTEPSRYIPDALMESVGIYLHEMPTLPPSVHGMRLQKLLMSQLNALGVDVIENADVCRADVSGGVCEAIYTAAPDVERAYHAERFIIATGGFLGGGLKAGVNGVSESIFGLTIDAPENIEDWSNPNMLSSGHNFASMGIRVNEVLQAVDSTNKPILSNVHFVGRTIGGYDFASELSGGGVALATAYTAGRL